MQQALRPLRDETNSISMDKPESETFSFPDIYTIASIIRRKMLRYEGININPLDIRDLHLDTAKSLLPKSLYWLIRWVVTGEQYSDDSPSSARSTTDEWKIVMAGQDLIHCASHARVKLTST